MDFIIFWISVTVGNMWKHTGVSCVCVALFVKVRSRHKCDSYPSIYLTPSAQYLDVGYIGSVDRSENTHAIIFSLRLASSF